MNTPTFCHPYLVRVTSLIALALASLWLLTGCGPEEQTVKVDLSQTVAQPEMAAAPRAADEYRFGFDLRISVEEDSRQYQPFLDYLSQATGYRFRLHFLRKDKNIAQQLAEDTAQFAAVGAVSSIQAQINAGAIPVVRGLNNEGKPSYRAMIVVAPTSPIKHLAQLRDKRMAFGDVNSTQGHIIPRIMLQEAGLGLRDFSEYRYTGSHRDCANAVILGKADACGMQDTLAEALVGEKQLRILQASREYPSSGITASRSLPPQVIDKVRLALLAFEPRGRHAPGLYNWDRTEMPRGFVAAGPDDYAELRDWLKRLDLLPEAKAK